MRTFSIVVLLLFGIRRIKLYRLMTSMQFFIFSITVLANNLESRDKGEQRSQGTFLRNR